MTQVIVKLACQILLAYSSMVRKVKHIDMEYDRKYMTVEIVLNVK